jgi:5-formyltetrahydrofolate cyclo-ligase
MEPLSKASLRAEARARIAALSPQERLDASSQICRRVAALSEWASSDLIALFSAQPSEPNPAALINGSAKAFCFPRISGATLDFHRCDSVDLLRPGLWKILEPNPAHCPVIPPSEIDLLLIPGLAFTRSGARLGRGRGFYDRLLSQVHPRAVKIGVCFQTQLTKVVPLEIHDHAVDFIVTEAEVIRCAHS